MSADKVSNDQLAASLVMLAQLVFIEATALHMLIAATQLEGVDDLKEALDDVQAIREDGKPIVEAFMLLAQDLTGDSDSE